MKNFFRSRDGVAKGAALMIALAFVMLLTGLALAYFTRTSTDRQLAQTSYNDTSADLLARSALDVIVGDFKQEILSHPPTPNPPNCWITPVPYTPTPPPGVSGSPIANLIRQSYYGDQTGRTSSLRSDTAISANGRSISTARWNSHYLVPRGDPSDTKVNPSPTPTFVAPNWVLVTGQGPAPAPPPNAVIGRYAFAVYDEGGLLDMSLAGYPDWSGLPDTSCNPNPSATPWLVNVGRKGTVAFADLTALRAAPTTFLTQAQVDNIVGWRNYAMTKRTGASFGSFNYSGETDCDKQNWYGSYLLYFGDPPFAIESLADKLAASVYPFTSVANYVSPQNRTDQSFMTRQELLKLRSSLEFSQNVLQYMGTFSRERNMPAPDWPHLIEYGSFSDGRFNLNNLALVIPNPEDCHPPHGRKVGWQTGKNRNHLCGTPDAIIELFGLFWVKSPDNQTPGYWKYIAHTGPNPDGSPDPNPHSVICFGGLNHRQGDFFQILRYALSVARNQTSSCGGTGDQARVFGIGASLIDQYDSGADCQTNPWGYGCDLDSHVTSGNSTHTTAIKYGMEGSNNTAFAYGIELDYSVDPVNGDMPCGASGGGSLPHRPSPAPPPITSPSPNQTIVVNHAFSNVGELGYAIDTSALPTPAPSPTPACAPTQGPTAVPTLKFWDNSTSPSFQDAPVLDFFSYNPISSAYPRAGIVNLYTRNASVLAAILKGTILKEATPAPTIPTPTPTPDPTPVVSAADAMTAANAIIAETQRVLAGNPTYGSVQQTDLTRAIAGRLAKAAFDQVPTLAASDETKEAVVRALAEMGQTRTWNVFIDVIAQTGKYKPNSPDLSGSNFVVEGEKRYWLHIALGRDPIQADGTPCVGNYTGCQVDVLGSQLEEVLE
jgi:hypothetical protein